MRPAARVAARVETLVVVFDGQADEKRLLAWAYSCRFAGSKDRAVIRNALFRRYSAVRRVNS